MTRQIEAVYENGVLRPLEPLPLAEHDRVTLTVTTPSKEPARSHLDVEFLEFTKRETAATENIPTLEEVQRMLSRDKGSWADLIRAERADRV